VRRVPPVLLAVPALAVARLLPAEGIGLGLRLAAATACLLIPGTLISRAFRLRGLAAPMAWSLAALLFALAITFAVHSSLWLTLALLGAVAVAALPFAVLANDLDHTLDRIELAVIAAGIAFGIGLWFVAVLDGDAFFHLARVRKLEVFDSLSLQNVGEFKDGSLHPGYAFPLWHGFLALVARLADVDPIAVGRNGPTVLAPLQFALFYEAGKVLFRSAWAGVAVVIAEVSLTGIAAGHGGSFTSLALPATAARQLLVPALLALFFAHVRNPSRALFLATAAAAGTLALVHPTYALFVGVPLVGFAIARTLLVGRRELKPALTGIAALAVPTGIALAWLRPVVEATTVHNPSGQEVRRAFAQYPGQLTGTIDRYHVAERLFTRSGAVAIAALLCVLLAAFAPRRRWAAWVIGGSLAIFALTLVPFVFPHFADAVSISQGRRLVGFIPFPYAIAGGAAVLAGLLGFFVIPLALAAGILLELVYPGDFGYRFHGTTPAWPTWVAVAGGLVALLVGIVRRKGTSAEGVDVRHPAVAMLAVAAFAIPVAVHGFSHWTRAGGGSGALTRGLIKAFRADAKPKDVLFADPETGYLLAAYAPVYLADAPFGHVAVTKKNRPKQRLRDAYRFYAHGGDLSIPRSYGARWIIVDHKRHRLMLDLPRAYADRRYVLYRLR
jgi:hypothetical protein